MSVRDKPCSQDAWLQEVFGVPVDELYEKAIEPDAAPVLTRALELRSFLALAEEQVARIRDRMHEATAPDHPMEDLSAADLRMDTQWLEAALAAREGYRSALNNLLSSPLPLRELGSRPVRSVRHKVTMSMPPTPSGPAVGSAQAGRTSRVRKSGIA